MDWETTQVSADLTYKMHVPISLMVFLNLIAGSAAVAIVSFFLLPFLFEVAGMPPFYAAAIVLIARLWDAVTDPVVGRMSDMTNTKWGRRRPWLVSIQDSIHTSFEKTF
jgi:GPH family glycoside/pentoside/hexuronide:cation symporter